jgi:hypothetical protein
MQGAPVIGLGEEISGFPVVWVGTNHRWYGSTGLDITQALQKALQQALLKAQNQAEFHTTQTAEVSSMLLKEKVPINLVIHSSKEKTHGKFLKSARQVLNRNNHRLAVFDLDIPSFSQAEFGVFGVLLRKEESG